MDRSTTKRRKKPSKGTHASDGISDLTTVNLNWRHNIMARLMNVSVHRLQGRVMKIMAHEGYPEIRLAHVNLTRNLDVEGTTITELANRAAMTKQAMGELVDQCEIIGIIERTVNPNDRRVWIIKFTDRGITWLDKLKNTVALVESEMIDVIGEPAFKSITDWLRAYNSAELPKINAE